MAIVNKLKDSADVATPPSGYKTLFIRSDNGVPALKDSDGNVANLSIGGDASGVTYTPEEPLNWTDSVDPGNVDDALDDLALRVNTLESEGVPDASQITYEPSNSLNWTDSEDPGAVGDALDDLAQRVQALEENPGGGGGGTGDVTGPPTSTSNAIARWNGTGGDTLADSGVSIDGSNNVSGVAALSATTVELGHASDTTLSRASAGDVAVEGNVLYRAGGTDVPVADGGTGVSSLTAYAPVFGGTTSTGAVQSGSVGTAGQVLKSNGAGALPTFQDNKQCIAIACSDETTALTTGTAKATFRMPYAMTLTSVKASVTTAPTDATLNVDINKTGVGSILSTVITIDATEKTSASAATPPVISTSSLSDDDEITIDIDQVGSTIAGAGLKVYLIGTPG